MLRARRAWALSCLLAALSTQAAAFVPPTSFILRRMAAKVSGLRGLSAEVGGELDVSGAWTSAQGRLHIAAPDRFRLELTHAGGRTVETWLGAARSLQGAGQAQTSTAKASHPVVALFFGNARAYLGEVGIDASTVTLGRHGAQVCWVIGSKAEDASKPQLWIDKETFLPVRILTFDGEPRRASEWRFDGYERGAAGGFPRQLEQHVDGKRVLRVGIVSADTTRVPSDSLFTTTAP